MCATYILYTEWETNSCISACTQQELSGRCSPFPSPAFLLAADKIHPRAKALPKAAVPPNARNGNDTLPGSSTPGIIKVLTRAGNPMTAVIPPASKRSAGSLHRFAITAPQTITPSINSKAAIRKPYPYSPQTAARAESVQLLGMWYFGSAGT